MPSAVRHSVLMEPRWTCSHGHLWPKLLSLVPTQHWMCRLQALALEEAAAQASLNELRQVTAAKVGLVTSPIVLACMLRLEAETTLVMVMSMCVHRRKRLLAGSWHSRRCPAQGVDGLRLRRDQLQPLQP